MKLFTKSNQRGFGHVELVLLIAFVAVFAFIGIRVMHQSSALTLLNQKQCTLMGRTWSSAGTCNKVCAAGQGTYVVTSTYDYCSGAVTAASKMSASTCSSYGRVLLASSSTYVGCARRADQKTTANAPQCATAGQTYYVQSTYDKCGSATTATLSGKCDIISPSSVTAGVPYSSIKVRFTNTGTNTFNIAYDTAGGTSDASGQGMGHGYLGTYTSAGGVSAGSYKDVDLGGGTLNTSFKGGKMSLEVKNQSPSFTCSRTWNIL